MDSGGKAKAIMDLSPLFRIYEDGTFDRIQEAPFVAASSATIHDVQSKDVVISPENGVTARLYLPEKVKKSEKLPVLIYIPGAAFVLKPTFTKEYHSYLISIVSQANVIGLSIDYRAAPEYPIPACYHDCFHVMDWLASHQHDHDHVMRSSGAVLDPWIKEHADLTRVFVAGNGAGANIAHNMVVESRRGSSEGGRNKLNIAGMILIHPFFGTGEADGLWELICCDSKGGNDPRLYPMAHPDILSSLLCDKVLVCIAKEDFLRDRGHQYYEALKKSGYGGHNLDLFESDEGLHCFHIANPDNYHAKILMKRVVDFLSH